MTAEDESSNPRAKRTKPKAEGKTPGALPSSSKTVEEALAAAVAQFPSQSSLAAAVAKLASQSSPLAAAVAQLASQSSSLAAAVAQLPSQSSLGAALKIAALSSAPWKDLKGLDLSSQTRLQAEALKAMNMRSTLQLQTEALAGLGRTLPWHLGEAKESPPSKLETELRQLREELSQRGQALQAAQADNEGQEQEIAELTKTLEKLRERERYAFLLHQIHPAAHLLLEDSEEFLNRFLSSGECAGFVMSVDIRRSTDLMLKARQPERFAQFVSELCMQLAAIVLDSFGVFDKFTGDGILAFFPDFYSGPDAGYYAVTAAERCHSAFSAHYRASRSAFLSVLQEAGLGIGIDYGTFSLVQVSGAITVVGPPVVYACRMSGAPAGSTLLNQPAFEVISDKYGVYFSFDEVDLPLKHEGPTLAYRVHATGKTYEPAVPDWMNGGRLPAAAV